MKIDQNHIFISHKNNNELKKLGGTWNAKHHAWRFPKSIHALKEIEQALPDILQLEAYQNIKQTLEAQRSALTTLKQQAQATPQQQNDKLRPYQRQDVEYLRHIPNAAILNQPRTGKTPTVIETLKVKGLKKNLIICPASLLFNWKKEIKTWHPEASVHIFAGTPKQRKTALEAFQNAIGTAYLITSKDTAKRDSSVFPAVDALVIDEAHYLRNSETKQSEAIYALGKRAKHRYALTGTPTVKHPADIFGILKFLYPEKFTSYWQFVARYFRIYDNHFGKEIGEPIPKRMDELKDIIDAISTQRLRKDVMQWLPDKQRHKHLVSMTDKQLKLYNSMLEDFFAQQDDHEIDTQNVLSQLIRLRQICNDPALLKFDAPSAKTQVVVEIIDENTYTAPGEPIIIMSMFTSYLNLLKPMIEKLGKRVAMITGEMQNSEKQHSAEAFQAGHIDVLLCNIISAGTGFTLDRGEVIIFADLPYNPADMEQAEDRITPTTKENLHKHFIVTIECENSIDERINQIIERKESLTGFINSCKSIDTFTRFMLN